MMAKASFVVTNIGELITLDPLYRAEKVSGITARDLGRYENAWLAIKDGNVAGYGSGAVPSTFSGLKTHDAGGCLVLPGFVDAHTHTIYGGSRASEFARRLDGETYQSIAAAGGGIKYSVKATREASDEHLLSSYEHRLKRFLSHGVTTVEVKSGYGLTPKDELRLLTLINEGAKHTPLHVVATCLALHAKMPEFPSIKAYVDAVCEDLLPAVADQKLARYVDAFVERGYFEVEDVDPYIAKAHSLGLDIRIHADEFKDSGAAGAAARWGAHSADHLEVASAEGLALMAKAKTIGVLLPGTSLYTKIPFANAARLRDAGVGIALATDFNPGSCQVDNIGFVATIGALHCGLSLAETIAAVTYVPAFSLRLHKAKGSLAVGCDADFQISSLHNLESWVADLGRHMPESVFIAGTRVH